MGARFSNEFNIKYPYNPVVATLCALGGGVNPLVERVLELIKLGASLIKSLFQWKVENGKWKIVFIFPCDACSTLQDKPNTTSKIFNTIFHFPLPIFNSLYPPSPGTPCHPLPSECEGAMRHTYRRKEGGKND